MNRKHDPAPEPVVMITTFAFNSQSTFKKIFNRVAILQGMISKFFP